MADAALLNWTPLTLNTTATGRLERDGKAGMLT